MALINPMAPNKQLPTELPFVEALKVYAYRLAIPCGLASINIFLFALVAALQSIYIWILLPVLMLLGSSTLILVIIVIFNEFVYKEREDRQGLVDREINQPISNLRAEETLLDLATCGHLVTQILTGQDWHLLEAHTLAVQIWSELADKKLTGSAAGQVVQTQTRQRYSVVLHDAFRHPAMERRERAWLEMAHWLRRQAGRFTSEPDEQEYLVYKTLVDLQRRLDEAPLTTPQTLWSYALRILRREYLDWLQRQEAPKQPEDSRLPGSLTRQGSNGSDAANHL